MALPSHSLLAPENFEHVVHDCSRLVANEVAEKNLAIRSVFKIVRRAKPDLVERALKTLLPEFALELDPVYAEFLADKEPSFVNYVGQHREDIAVRLLQVTDRRVEATNSKAIRSGYKQLRGRANKEVMQALPRVAAVVDKYHNQRTQNR